MARWPGGQVARCPGGQVARQQPPTCAGQVLANMTALAARVPPYSARSIFKPPLPHSLDTGGGEEER